MQHIAGIGGAVGSLQYPGDVVEPPVHASRRQPAEDFALRLSYLGAHIDGAAPRIEVLIAGVHSLGHRDRTLLPQAPREFSEQVPRLLVAQAERAKPGRKPPARLASSSTRTDPGPPATDGHR